MAENSNPHANLIVGAQDEATPVFEKIKGSAKEMGDGIKQSSNEAKESFKRMGDEAKPTSAKVEASARSIIGSIERATAAMKAGEKGTASYFEALAAQRGVSSDLLKPYIEQLRQAEAAQQAAILGQGSLGMSAKATAAAMRQVPAQFQDIIVSLQGGQKPMTVFLQQGSQLSTVFGGAGAAAKALGGYVLGLVNPFTLAAGAAAGAFFVYESGQESVRTLNAALLESQGRIGLSADELQSMASALASEGFSRNTAATALAAVSTNAIVAKTDLQGFTQIALDLEKYAGRSIEDTTERLKKLTDEPSKTAAEMNLLTAAQYEQAKAMEKSGDMTDAAKLALTAYGEEAARVIAGYKGDLSKLDYALDFYARKGREMWNALTGSTIGDTADQRISKLKQRLAEINGPLPFQNASFSDRVAGMFDSEGVRSRMRSDAEEQLRYLERTSQAQKDSARYEAERQRIQREGIAAFDEVARAQDKGLTKQQQLNKALSDYDANLKKIRLANPDSAALTDDAIKRGQDAIRKQYEDKGAASRARAEALKAEREAAKLLAQDLANLAESAGLSPSFYKDWNQLDDMFRRGKLSTDELTEAQAKLLAKQPAIKAAADEQKKAQDELNKARDQFLTDQSRYFQGLTDETEKMAQSNAKLREEIDMLGLSARERATYEQAINSGTIAKLKDKLATIEMFDAESEVSNQLREQIRILEERNGLIGQKAEKSEHVEEIKKAGDEYKRITEQYEQGLINAAMQGGKSLKEYVAGMLRATAFRIVLQPIMGPLAGLLSSITGGGSGGGTSVLGAANAGMNAYNLFSGTGGNMGAISGFASGTMSAGNALGSLYANATGTGIDGLLALNGAYGTAPASTAGLGAGWAALPVALAALGWFGSSYFDKGDTYSGAAYATSGGNDPLSVVRPGLTNYDPVTGDLPDRDALISQLTGLGANSSDLAGVNDRSLLHLLRLAEIERRMERDGGPMMSWDTWIRDGSKDDFYRGPGYANPEAMGWWDNDPAGGYQGSMNYLLADPKIVEASRKLSEGILAPLDSISQALGLDSDFRVTTGMARNDKTGNIFGGLAIQNNGQEVFNSGKQEFDSQGEYLRATFANTLSAFDSLDLPDWAQAQADGAKKKLDELKPGETLGSDAAKIYADATSGIAATIHQISSLIKIVPELGGASQDAVYNIGQAMGTLDNFVSTYGGYVQNFYTEAERFDYIRAGINDTLSAFDIGVTADTTREQFRALVEAQDLTTESGQKTFAALMQVSGAFAEITPEVDGLTQQLQQMASQIGGDLTNVLTQDLLGNLTGADLGGQMADVVIGGAYNALAGNAAQQISAIMTEGLITPLLRAATTNAAVSDAVTQASIDATVAKAKEAITVFGAILNDPAFQEAMKEIDGAIRSITASMPSQPYYTAYQPQKVNDYADAVKSSADEAERAAKAIRDSWTSISESLMDEVRRIRGELADGGDQSMAYWQSQFAMDSAAARAGDEEAAKRLTDISGSLLDAAGREAASMLELQQMRAWVAQSLQDTAGYAAARGNGALTTTAATSQTYVLPALPANGQAPIVVSADPGLLTEFRKLNEKVQAMETRLRLIADQQLEDLRIKRSWNTAGLPKERTLTTS
ncbi:MAG: phage tail length tape measure family protein [Ottowia sp.]|uniref:phage tail length tape measure family protein n=1 Tax=Ottowia sp. TaxID=1898956 RepID=UPI003C71C435